MTSDLTTKDNEKQPNSEHKKPEGLFRKSGVAALIGTIATIGACGYLFADSIAKFALKQGMELTFGAETNVSEVSVSWSPFGITLDGLAQTDASEPTKNLFELQQASAQIDVWQLMLGKYVVEQLSVEQLALGTTRAVAGEVFENRLKLSEGQTESVKAASKSLGLTVPSSEDLLAKLDLQTEKKGRALEQTWNEEKPKLEQAFESLPNKQTLKALKADWKRIESIELKSPQDFEKLRAELKQLKTKIDKERAAVKQAKNQYQESKGKLDVAYDELQQAAKDDWRRVEEQVSFDDPNAVALANMLFGDEVAGYVEQAQMIWQKAQPYLAKQKEQKALEQQAAEQKWSQSKNIEFPLQEAWPDWIIKDLTASALVKENLYQITGSEINLQSYVRQKPSLYQVALNDEFKLNGEYYVDNEMKITSSGTWQVANLAINQKSLSDSKDLTLSLTQAAVAGKGKYSIDKQLQSSSQLTFTKADFRGKATTKLAQLTQDTLDGVDHFNVDLSIAGDISKPSIKIKSDLDKQLSSAFKSALNKEWGKVKQQTQAKLQAKLNNQFSLEDTGLAEFQKKLTGADNELDVFGSGSVEDMVKQQTKAYEEKLKQKAKDKLKDKLKGLFGG